LEEHQQAEEQEWQQSLAQTAKSVESFQVARRTGRGDVEAATEAAGQGGTVLDIPILRVVLEGSWT